MWSIFWLSGHLDSCMVTQEPLVMQLMVEYSMIQLRVGTEFELSLPMFNLIWFPDYNPNREGLETCAGPCSWSSNNLASFG